MSYIYVTYLNIEKVIRCPLSVTILAHKGFSISPVSRHFPYSVNPCRISPISTVDFQTLSESPNTESIQKQQKSEILYQFLLPPLRPIFSLSWTNPRKQFIGRFFTNFSGPLVFVFVFENVLVSVFACACVLYYLCLYLYFLCLYVCVVSMFVFISIGEDSPT